MELVKKRGAIHVSHTVPFPALLLPGTMLKEIVREDGRERDTYGEGDNRRDEYTRCVDNHRS